MNSERATLKSEATTQPILLREFHDNVAILTLNRSKARNSLSESMITALHQALKEISDDKTIRAVVIASTGPAFCAGHDLKEMTAHRGDADAGRAYFERIMRACSEMMQAIVRMKQPVIAAVQGVATAAGCQLVASCDLAIAASDAKFATPGVDIGLFCSTPMVALSRNVSRKHAMQMLLTGEMTTAEEAVRIGLINRSVTPGTELAEAKALAHKIAQKSPHSVKVGKAAFYRQIEMDLTEAYKYTAEIMVENLLTADASEGICAFIEKRSPQWDN